MTINIDDLTYGQLKQIAAEFGGAVNTTPDKAFDSAHIGKWVVVRSADSGVHAGMLVSQRGTTVRLTDDPRRLWYWVAAQGHTLSAVAIHGITADSKIAQSPSGIEVFGVCEIIPMTKAAMISVRDTPCHEPD